MSHIWSVARKELRGYFSSPVAVIFIATFLAAVLFTFFVQEKFLSRGLADIRPLFDWLPILLIFLVGALTMRSWAEEAHAGTIEVLLTLPVPTWKLVTGKFIAGLLLIAIALGITLSLPITVSLMGDLDWGPVAGGYLAALLLAGAYLAIGLCVSASTDNQIVSLALSVALCFALYLPGTDALSGGSYAMDEILGAIGIGSRFDSVARGLIDLRDLAYYCGLILFFLVLNIFILRRKAWSSGESGRGERRHWIAVLVLLAVNVFALNFWLGPITSTRIDLTENGEYFLSDSTKRILKSLDEPLTIRGYFSEKTHPLLAPLVPQIRDRLEEYGLEGGSNVRVEFVDPSKNEELEKEANEQFNIKSVPFQFKDRVENTVVNSYFHVLVQYGDQFEVLSYEDLIEVSSPSIGQIEVKLRNLEYDMTKAIKKVIAGFQSIDTLFATMPRPPVLTLFYTPAELPEDLAEAEGKLEAVVEELRKRAGGKFEFKKTVVDSQELQQKLFDDYQMRPYSLGLLSGKAFYMHLLLEAGDSLVRIQPPNDWNEAGIKSAIIEGLKRTAPGFTKTIAIAVPPAPPPQPPDPRMGGRQPPPPQPPQNFNLLRRTLSENYTVQDANLASGRVADAVDALIIAGPENLAGKQLRAIDQFLMRGGAVLFLTGAYRLNLKSRELAVEEVKSGVDQLLASYGVSLKSKLLVDPESDSFPVPVMRDLGGVKVREIQRVKYPYFAKISGDGLAEHPTTAGLNALILHYASPVALMTPAAKGEAPAKVETATLLKSSKQSWLQTSTKVSPDFRAFPDTGFGVPDKIEGEDKGPHTLAIAAYGTFNSHFTASGQQPKGDGAAPPAADDEPTIERSPPDTRLVVVGSSSFVADELLQLSQQAGSQEVQSNLKFVQNLVDWALADTDLLSIRSRGTHTRVLDIDRDKRTMGLHRWEFINLALFLLALALIVGITWLRQSSVVKMALDTAAKDGWTGAGASSTRDSATGKPIAAASEEEE